MLKNKFLWTVFLPPILLVLASCSPFASTKPASQPLPSPGQDWSAVLTQTGGFAGVDLTVEVASDGQLTARDQRTGREVTEKLSPQSRSKLSRLILATESSARGQMKQSACADCFLYELQIQMNGRTSYTRVDDTRLQDSGVADLIAFLQDLRDGALKR